MSTRQPAPYAPDMFSEHARLAQLGARVLEILRDPQIMRLAPDGCPTIDDCALRERVQGAARSLGLLGDDQ